MLRDRFVYGLLARPKILKAVLCHTFAQTRDIAVSMELAEENVKLTNDFSGKSNVLKLKDTCLQVSYYRCSGKLLAS